MSMPEEKIVKIVDESLHSRGVSVEQVSSQGALIVKAVDTTVSTSQPLPIEGQNPSLVLAYDSGNVSTITKTIGTESYRKTLTWTDGVLTNISVWEEV